MQTCTIRSRTAPDVTDTVVYRAAWVLPITAAPIADGAVAVQGEQITFVGTASDAPAGRTVDLGQAALLPGLVNVHTHLELTPLRHLLEGLDFAEWIRVLTHLRRTVLTTAAELEAGARLGIAEGLLRGITTFADTSDTALPVVAALDAMGVRGIVYKEVFGPDPRQCETSMAGLRDAVAQLRTRETAAVRIGISPHAPYSVSRELFAAAGDFAMRDALPMAIHLAESAAEEALVVRGDGPYAENWRRRGIDPAGARARSSVALLQDAGVLRARPLIIHAVRVDADDIAALAAADCPVAHCPVSNARFGHGIAPLTAMAAAGLRIGLGTDSVASNNRMDLLDEARVAHLMACTQTRDWAALPAAQALWLATAGGGRALGAWPGLGALQVGAPADLAAFALDGPTAAPLADVADALVHGLAGSPARLTVARGVELVRDGALVRRAAYDRDLVDVRHIGERLLAARDAMRRA
jgi:cytosine/adenosine deaminase-related metal-dependent hydrolase